MLKLEPLMYELGLLKLSRAKSERAIDMTLVQYVALNRRLASAEAAMQIYECAGHLRIDASSFGKSCEIVRTPK